MQLSYNYNVAAIEKLSKDASSIEGIAKHAENAKKYKAVFHFFRGLESQYKADLSFKDPAAFISHCTAEIQTSLAKPKTNTLLTDAINTLLTELTPYLFGAFSERSTL